jgi:hypothetical protein
MTIQEKIVHPALDDVFLYREGIFWMAYEQSAYAVSQVKTLKAVKKYVKVIGREVVSVGFPDAALAKVSASFNEFSKDGNRVKMKAQAPIAIEAFEAWKNGLPLFVVPALIEAHITPDKMPVDIVGKIRQFDIANKTPVECMTFLAELKKSI